MTTSTLTHRSTAQLLRWEFSCVAAEACGVGIGLYLMLATEQAELGGGVMFLTLATSAVARCIHYCGLGMKH
jgi:hypothetical protein